MKDEGRQRVSAMKAHLPRLLQWATFHEDLAAVLSDLDPVYMRLIDRATYGCLGVRGLIFSRVVSATAASAQCNRAATLHLSSHQSEGQHVLKSRTVQSTNKTKKIEK